MLLKVWLRQRDVCRQSGGLSGFQLSLLLVHLLAQRTLSYQMGAYHIVRVVLHFLSRAKLGTKPIVLPPSPADEAAAAAAAKAAAADEEDDDDDDEGAGGNGKAGGAKAAAAQAHLAAAKESAAEAARAFAAYFPLVIVDSHGGVNYGGGVSAGALDELSAQATLSLAALDAHALSDATSFATLFTSRQPLSAAYDAVLSLAMPEADAPPPPAAGALALPTHSPDDPTEGLALLGYGAGTAAGLPVPSAAEMSTELAVKGAMGGGTSAVEALLRRGLGARCEWVRAWRPRLAPWSPLGQPPPRRPELFAGVQLDYSAAQNLVVRAARLAPHLARSTRRAARPPTEAIALMIDSASDTSKLTPLGDS